MSKKGKGGRINRRNKGHAIDRRLHPKAGRKKGEKRADLMRRYS